ncbi:MAG: flavin reductase [Arenicellales bacterium]|nr:flavin reductase [Arenicellales bacterium]MDP6291218.1 flavin reductase [Arenicellales bacterium]HJL56505.1 hypothetical protein [Arenicellales bacterium]
MDDSGVVYAAAGGCCCECRLIDSIEAGDHFVFVGEIVDAGVSQEPEGRADEATLWLKELGEKAFYGG